VCNLYSSYTTQEAMRRAFEVARDNAGNVPPLPAIFPDQMAPVVRMVDGERKLIQMRWGFPPPPKVGTQPVSNVRNVSSPFWRAWLKPQYRCLVPLTSFRLWPTRVSQQSTSTHGFLDRVAYGD
jgi:putative SOS response-associated peptidase YedK